MRSQLARWGGAVLAPLAFLVASAWWGGRVIELQQRQGVTFEIDGLFWATSLGYLLAATGALVVFAVCLWARSRLVALAYVAVGAFVLFDQPLAWAYGAQINNAPPIAPAPVVTILNETFRRLESGPVGAAQVVGAAMLLGGLAELARRVPGMRVHLTRGHPELPSPTR